MNKHVLHKRSSESGTSDYKITAKLPTSSDVDYGEIAVNFRKGSETLSIKNSNNEIVPLPNNEVMVNAVGLNNDLSYSSSTKILSSVTKITDAVDTIVEEIINNELSVSETFTTVQESVGLDKNMKYTPGTGTKYISGSSFISQALDELDNAIATYSGGGSTVSFTQIKKEGDKIGTITIDGTDTDLYCNTRGSEGSTVSVSAASTSGNEVATITVDGTPTTIYSKKYTEGNGITINAENTIAVSASNNTDEGVPYYSTANYRDNVTYVSGGGGAWTSTTTSEDFTILDGALIQIEFVTGTTSLPSSYTVSLNGVNVRTAESKFQFYYTGSTTYFKKLYFVMGTSNENRYIFNIACINNINPIFNKNIIEVSSSGVTAFADLNFSGNTLTFTNTNGKKNLYLPIQTVSVIQAKTSGDKIGTIAIDGVNTDLYCNSENLPFEYNSNESGIQTVSGHNTASGNYSLAEGFYTNAVGDYSHTEGRETYAYGYCSHSEGCGTIASGYSHAEGWSTQALVDYSSSHGQKTIASANTAEAAFGKFNISSGNTIFTVGIGTEENNRKNGLEVHTNGDVKVQLSGSSVTLQDYMIKIVTLTQAEYDALTTKDNNTIYLISD